MRCRTMPLPHAPFDRSRRRHLAALWGACLALAAPALRAQSVGATIGGVSFAGAAEVGGQPLQLNGVGLRASPAIKGFACGLYLAQSTRSAEQALRAPGAKRLRLRMMIDVPTELFVRAVRKYVARNVGEAQLRALLDRLGRFDASLRAVGQVSDGDVIDLDYLPGAGLVLAINGRPRSTPIPGEDLYTALMLVFLGERPVDQRLKAGLLGARTS